MKTEAKRIFNKLLQEYPQLGVCSEEIDNAFAVLRECYRNGGKLLVCGNGGSAADSEHIVGELMKSFLLKRRINENDISKLRACFPDDWNSFAGTLQGALPAISLVSHSALISAYVNDVEPEMVFAQQVYGYGKAGDVLMALSTSGNSRNVVNAVKTAKAFGMKTIGMTGENGGLMKAFCDLTIAVPAGETYRIQEYHVPIYHALCAMLEVEFFDE